MIIPSMLADAQSHVGNVPIHPMRTAQVRTKITQPALSLDQLRIRYEPFPIGFCEDFLDADFYGKLLSTWPAHELFQYKPTLGNKYSLSEVNHPRQYQDFIAASPNWKMFHRLIKAPAFIEYVLDTLCDHNIDLGYPAEMLSARFEFSMLAGNGGHIRPHTDAPNKLVTLVLCMVGEGEWSPAYGGGTAVLKPKDPARTYNHLNIQMGFEEMNCLEAFPFVPNACVVFVKTFNSYHAVYPIQGVERIPRRSLTINIEDTKDARLGYLRGRQAAFRK